MPVIASTKRWWRPLAAACCAWLAFDRFAPGQEAAFKADSPSQQARLLIEQLGDESFGVREQAADQLTRLGSAALPELKTAIDDPDAEVRFRARRIVALIVATDFDERLRAFAADIEDARGLSLPGWPAFKQSIGADPASRALFVEMQQSEAALLQASSEGPERAAPALADRARILYEQSRPRDRRAREQTPVSIGSLAAVLWVAGDPSVKLPDKVAAGIIDLPVNPTIQRAMALELLPRREALRKIFGRWVAREVSPVLVAMNLRLASTYNLREAIGPAASALQKPNLPAEARCYALMVLGKFGGKEHLPLVESRFDDTEPCANFGGFNRHLQTQIRDVALAAAVQLADQQPGDFGLDQLQEDGQGWYLLNTIGFAADADRSAALAKWENWKNTARR